jgi:hypothetical protein
MTYKKNPPLHPPATLFLPSDSPFPPHLPFSSSFSPSLTLSPSSSFSPSSLSPSQIRLWPPSQAPAADASPPPDRWPQDLAYEAWIRPPRPLPRSLAASSSTTTTSPTAGSGHRSLSPDRRPLPPPSPHRQPRIPPPRPLPRLTAASSSTTAPPTAGSGLDKIVGRGSGHRGLSPDRRPLPPPPPHCQPPDPASTSLGAMDPAIAASPPTVGRFLLRHRTVGSVHASLLTAGRLLRHRTAARWSYPFYYVPR